jgi:hypothetical protein
MKAKAKKININLKEINYLKRNGVKTTSRNKNGVAKILISERRYRLRWGGIWQTILANEKREMA